MRLPFAAAALFLPSVVALRPAEAQLLIPDSAGDRVMLFSRADGSVINPNWVTDQGAVGWSLSMPREATAVGQQVWVSDQLADALMRFDSDGNFLGSITAHPAGGTLDNVRGFGVTSSRVYLTVFHGTAASRGVASYAVPAGTPAGFFQSPASLFDAEPFAGDLLVSNSTTDRIERWTTAGTFVSTFASGVVFPQQVVRLSDGSVLTVSSIASPGVEGVYHFNADGSLRLFIDTEPLKGAFGEHVPRGAFLLDSGDYLISTSLGVFKALGSGPPFVFQQMLGGVDGQYIGVVPGPACACDWNEDAMLNSQDYFDFLTDFFTGAADLNQDGLTNSQDYFDFLICFFSGC
jgi:hypothetical protein